MADETVVTELIIDARGAEAGSAAYVKAMKSAQVAYDKAMDSANAATEAVAKQTTVMTGAAGSITSTARAWDRFKASVDPVFAATQRMEKALLTADAAAKKLGVDQNEINRVLDLARAKHLGVAVAVEEGAHASALGATQMASLGHAARSAAESLALGQSPMMALTQQANHLSYAMSGPQGIIAASAGVRAAFGTWLTTLPGMLSVAGVAAVAAVGVYMLATREDIKSVDEILQGHKKILDDIAKSYPHLTEELKKYQNEAAKLPGAVIAANIGDQVDEAKKTLASQEGKIAEQIRLATTNPLTGDRGDFSNFGDKAYAILRQIEDGLDGTAAGAMRAQSELGKLRIDSSVSKDAHDFASGLQDAADQAVKVAASIDADLGLKSIGPDGQKATKTLAEVAAGFKDTGNKASGADATIAKLFGTISSNSNAGFGVSKGAGIQGIVGQFEQAGQAIQNMRREQVQSMLDLTAQFRDTTSQVDTLKKAIATAGGKENIQEFFGDVSNIKNANSELQNSVDVVNRLFDQLNSGSKNANAVANGLDLIRQTLVNDGFGVDQVNKFIDSLIKAREQMDAGIGNAKQLNAAIQAIKNRTVTITVVTQQVGTGTKSTYDVGTTGGIGVTRYGGTSDMTQQSYQVPSTGYGSQGGSADGGTTGVTVTRFGGTRAAGGPVSAHTPYWVGEHGPELVVPSSAGSVVPNGQSLAMAQSGFTGRDPTTDSTRYYTVFMNIEANTRKTFNAIDDLRTSGSIGGSSGSSSGSTAGKMTSVGGELYDSNGLNSGGHTAAQVAAFRSILTSAMSNYSAIGGMGLIGYGANGLAATPQQIAYNLAYGGGQSVGIPSNSRVGPSAPTALHGGDPYNAMLNGISPSSPGYADAYAKALAASNKAAGFSTGGMIAPGDSQQVSFFKSPDEAVAIFTPSQMKAIQGEGSKSSGDNRPITQTFHVSIQAPDGNVSKESQAALRAQFAAIGRDMARAVNGR